MDRVFRLLSLLYDWGDIRAARWAIERGAPRDRASAIEFLDNMLSGSLRKMILPLIDEGPLEEKVHKGKRPPQNEGSRCRRHLDAAHLR